MYDIGRNISRLLPIMDIADVKDYSPSGKKKLLARSVVVMQRGTEKKWYVYCTDTVTEINSKLKEVNF